MKINEIFKSIQGESSFAGLPCVFVRLAGCNLRCSYCDTTYAYEKNIEIAVDEILEKVKSFNCPLVEITGGEPLLQKETYLLVNKLLDASYRVLIETNGSLDISRLDERAIRIMDIKCPGGGESDKIRWENIDNLRQSDEVKFVLSDQRDYEWAKEIIEKHRLLNKAKVLLSVAFNRLAPEEVVKWMLKDNLNVRFQLQLHKYIGKCGEVK